VQAGVELVATLQRLGWRYSVSSTRPPWNAHAVRQWVWSNMPVRPVAFYVDRPGKLSTAECKRRHYVEAVAATAHRCVRWLSMTTRPRWMS